ncbi:MAG: helix-turn-helix domain-containing protein [Actinobacteria bacterium]|nr:helix-turn-helix domain-containing protein [Actinomycetota bacterium]
MDLLDESEAAEYLHVSAKSLSQWRYQGRGPCFCKIEGCVRYVKSDLDEWILSRRRRSTSDQGRG